MFQDLKPYPDASPKPAGWQQRRVGVLARLIVSNVDKLAHAGEEPVRLCNYVDVYRNAVVRDEMLFMAATATTDEIERFGVRVGDVALTKDSESAFDIAIPAYISSAGPDLLYGYHLAVLRPDPRFIAGDYLYLALTVPEVAHQFHVAAAGVTRFGLSRGDIKSAVVPVPPLDEQRAIVTYLAHAHERINKAISTKRRLIALLEEQQRVVASEAIRGTLTSTAPLIDSGIPYVGQVPADWHVERLGWHIDLLAGFPFESSGFITDADGVRLLRGANVGVSGVVWDDVVRWPAENASGVSAFALKEGDLVLGLDRPVIRGGVRVARVSADDIPSILVQRVARLRARPTLDSEFLRLSLAGQGFKDYLAPIFTGISVPHLSPKQVRDFRLAVPPIEEQRRIVAQVAGARLQLESATAVAHQEIRLLEEFRTRLTADVVTGQVDVRSIAASLPAIDLADVFAVSAGAVDADDDEMADEAGMEDE